MLLSYFFHMFYSLYGFVMSFVDVVITNGGSDSLRIFLDRQCRSESTKTYFKLMLI